MRLLISWRTTQSVSQSRLFNKFKKIEEKNKFNKVLKIDEGDFHWLSMEENLGLLIQNIIQ